MLKKECICVNGWLNECEPCDHPENHGYSFIIATIENVFDELFEVADNPNYVENTEQKF